MGETKERKLIMKGIKARNQATIGFSYLDAMIFTHGIITRSKPPEVTCIIIVVQVETPFLQASLRRVSRHRRDPRSTCLRE